jgi:hypothetical protein
VGDRGAGDLSVEEEGGALDLLADKEADEREHGDSAVGELGLAEAADLVLVGALEEVEGVAARGERNEVKGWPADVKRVRKGETL